MSFFALFRKGPKRKGNCLALCWWSFLQRELRKFNNKRFKASLSGTLSCKLLPMKLRDNAFEMLGTLKNTRCGLGGNRR